MGGRTVISPTARGWRIRRRWRGQFPPDKTPIQAMVHRRWLVEATCLGIPPERWVWQVAGWRESVRAVEEVAAALGRGDPSPGTLNWSSTCRRRDDHLPGDPAEGDRVGGHLQPALSALLRSPSLVASILSA